MDFLTPISTDSHLSLYYRAIVCLTTIQNQDKNWAVINFNQGKIISQILQTFLALLPVDL